MQFLRQIFETLLYPLRALLTSPGKISSGARWLTTLSIPARISIVVFVLMLAGVGGFFVANLTQDATMGRILMEPMKWVALALLTVVTPIVLYFVLRLWTEPDVSRFPDIDRDWKAGMDELRRQGLELGYTPFFLVLGSHGDLAEKSLFNASKLPLRVRDIPQGSGVLHWFADPNGVYLVCSEVGCLSKLAVVAKRAADEAKSYGVSAVAQIPGDIHPAAPPRDLTSTVMLDEAAAKGEVPVEVAKPLMVSQLFPPSPAGPGKQDITGTVLFDGGQPGNRGAVYSPAQQAVALTQEELRLQELRLEYLCHLIVAERRPLAPINGVMALLSYSSVEMGRREGSDLQRAVKRDLDVLGGTLKVRCPVVSLVTGMEEENGFRELVRRMGRDVATNQRFGKGYSVGNPPLPAQLEAVAAHACALFESTVYQLFREKGALSKRGNTRLYALLCKVRRSVRVPLTNVLKNGFSADADAKKKEQPPAMFFSGCYFAATGEADDRQAFVKAVFEKLPKEQEELEWTESALLDEDRYRRWATVALWVDSLLLIAIPVLGYLLWNRR